MCGLLAWELSHQYLEARLIRQFKFQHDAINPPRPVEGKSLFTIFRFEDLVVRRAALQVVSKAYAVGAVTINEED